MPNIGIRNYQQQTLEQLLKKNFSYEVPYFQREFSWGKDDWDDLLEDTIKAMKEKKGHFFGFMTFSEAQDAAIPIIEGQQRLTTVSILLSVARDLLLEMDEEYWKRLNEEYIKSTDILNPETPPFFKLILSEMNKDFFRKYIQEEDIPIKKIEKYKTEKKVNLSNDLIFKCYKFFYDEFKKKTEKMDNKATKNYLIEIVRTVLREFIVITAEVADSYAAYNIFQTLNDRGLDLTITDLLKIYLFEKAKNSWRDAKEKWDAIREILSVVNTNAFLRHYWLSTHGVVQEKHLLKEIASNIKTQAEVFKFLEDLKGEAEAYEALLNPKIDYWANKSVVDLLNELQILTTQMTLPLLMAGSRLQEKEFINLLKLCIGFTFRYLTVAEAEHKVLEKLFSDIAIGLREGTIKSSEQIKKRLSGEYHDDDTFMKLFAKKEIKVAKVAKYLLMKIDDFLSQDKEKYSEKITLEHVLPRNPDKEWIEYIKKFNIEKDELVNRIGNLTLLIGKVNKEAQNAFFTKKVHLYKKNTKLIINEPLKEIKSWTKQDIENRQKWLADKAVQIWRI